MTDSTTKISSSKRNGYLGRFFLFLLAAGGIACSILAALSCEFLTFDNNVPSPFPNGTTSIGIFRYDTITDTSTTASCLYYDEQFWDSSSFTEFFWASQLAAIVAPGLAVLAMSINLMELVGCCRFCGIFLLPFFLYLSACVVQGCTFLMYGQTRIFYRSEDTNSQLTMGAILSIAAGAAYYVCLILLCCLPRGPDPCCFQRRTTTESRDMVEERVTFDDANDDDDEENCPPIDQQQQQPWADPDALVPTSTILLA